MKSERYYIEICRKQIEKQFLFGNGNGYTQRDLEFLSNHIEEKTGVNISLSTLKRLWKDNYKQSPQLATLNALVAIIDYKDWQDFKKANKAKTVTNKKKGKYLIGAIGFLLVVIALGFALNINSWINRDIKIKGEIAFKADKTVTSGIPNTVIFKYDVSNVEADSFLIQQSWNDLHRQIINPDDRVFSRIYYESGFHRAGLYANDSLIAGANIHILSNGWEPHVYYSEEDKIPFDFRNEDFIIDGALHLNKQHLTKLKVDQERYYFSRITNSQAFNIHSDNFSLKTRVKIDSVFNTMCPWITLLIVTDVHIFRVGLIKKGCERYAAYKLGEITKEGAQADLSAFGLNLYEWQELEVKVKDKHASILINGKVAAVEDFKEDLGKIVGFTYIMEGTGYIDYIQLWDAKGKLTFEDPFEKESSKLTQ